MKGILFKPEMIKAVIEGRKTQTRRVIRQLSPEYEWEMIDTGEPIRMFKDGVGGCIFLKPRYQVGETVYIKEAHYRYGEWRKNGLTKTGRQKWLFHPMPEMLEISRIKGVESLRYFDNPPDEVKPNSYRKEGWYKRSLLFMPEWTARYFITITDVRAERLQEITLEGIRAEGIGQEWLDARGLFKELWNSINKDYPWESNPWCFVYTFERSEGIR